MGRITELVDFYNRKKLPTEREIQFYYHYIRITNELKKLCGFRVVKKRVNKSQKKSK